MVEFKKLTYEVLQVGEEFTSNDHVVTPEDIEAYAFAVDDHHAWLEFEFLEPIRPGVRVRSYGRVVDKYERRGKPYMVTERD
jgi:acyl dehydratase